MTEDQRAGFIQASTYLCSAASTSVQCHDVASTPKHAGQAFLKDQVGLPKLLTGDRGMVRKWDIEASC